MANLCVTCNLCCNGSLFGRVPVTPAEQARLPEDMEFFTREGKLRMRQPCPRLGSDGGCTCYEIRPEVCQTYNCKLSKKALAGEISEADAIAITEEIKKVQQQVCRLAEQALGKPKGALEGMPVSRAVSLVNKALKKKQTDLNAFAARRAMAHRARLTKLVQLHLQTNHRRPDR